MSVTVTCTPGGGSDNSYISSTDADSYFADSLREASWDALGAEDRARALIQATREIETLGGVRETLFTPKRVLFGGQPYSDDQTLHFPRTTDVDDDGDKRIPPAIEEAVCEQALFLLERRDNPELLDRDALQDAGVRIVITDGLHEHFGSRSIPRGIAPAAWMRMRPFVEGAGVASRAVAGE